MDETSPAVLIDRHIASLSDWRGEMLAGLRAIIRDSGPDIRETVKWRKPSNPLGVPVWECDGILCTGEVYRDKVKLTFANGASIDDPAGLFNSSLDGNTRRAIDFFQGSVVDAKGLRSLIQAAAARNAAAQAGRKHRR